MSAPDLPRFKVASVTGWGAGGSRKTTSYSVLDTWNAHAIVSAFYTPKRGSGRPIPRDVLARDRCAELEAWHEQAMTDDAA